MKYRVHKDLAICRPVVQKIINGVDIPPKVNIEYCFYSQIMIDGHWRTIAEHDTKVIAHEYINKFKKYAPKKWASLYSLKTYSELLKVSKEIEDVRKYVDHIIEDKL